MLDCKEDWLLHFQLTMRSIRAV